jgi:hypothetical protein
MRRRLVPIIAAGAAAVFLGGATIAHAGPGGPPEGVYAGTSQNTNNVSACAAETSTGLCTYSIADSYFDTVLGNGHMVGTYTVDWSTLAYNSNAGSNCANIVSGSIQFKLNSSSVLRTDDPAADGSQICQDTNNPGSFFTNLGLQIIGATGSYTKGAFKNMDKSATFIGFGGESFQIGTSGKYLDAGNTGVNLVYYV